MDPVSENGASATASVVVVARIRPKLPKEDKEPDGGGAHFEPRSQQKADSLLGPKKYDPN